MVVYIYFITIEGLDSGWGCEGFGGFFVYITKERDTEIENGCVTFILVAIKVRSKISFTMVSFEGWGFEPVERKSEKLQKSGVWRHFYEVGCFSL